jgi:hypothetical protein
MGINENANYAELINDYHKNPDGFVFFIGSGLSFPLFPTWAVFLENIIDASGFTENDKCTLRELLEQKNYLDVAEFCINAVGEIKYRDILEKTFDIDIEEKNISEAYKALFALSPQIIITTNYDRIPEVLSAGRYRIFTNHNAAECARAIMADKKVIFKIHGDITDQSSIVLKSSDYQKIIFSNQGTRQFLHSLLSTKRFIFIGFSLSDPHINSILENLKTINNGLPISHYLLLNEQSAVRIHLFENRYGVRIMPYSLSDSSHIEVVNFLRCLNTNQTENIFIKIAPQKIIVANDYSEYLFNELKNTFNENMIISISKKTIELSIVPIGQTSTEIQQELLALIKYFKYPCNDIDTIKIYLFSDQKASIDFDENQSLIMYLLISLDVVIKYNSKQISLSVLWDNISFYQPPFLSNPLVSPHKVSFPLNLQFLTL